jgi:hypothetical protein
MPRPLMGPKKVEFKLSMKESDKSLPKVMITRGSLSACCVLPYHIPEYGMPILSYWEPSVRDGRAGH